MHFPIIHSLRVRPFLSPIAGYSSEHRLSLYTELSNKRQSPRFPEGQYRISRLGLGRKLDQKQQDPMEHPAHGTSLLSTLLLDKYSLTIVYIVSYIMICFRGAKVNNVSYIII